MNKHTIILGAIILIVNANTIAQNVGIGTNQPLARLHVATTDTAVNMMENSTALEADVSTGIYFKTGTKMTGGIKTIGQNINAARLGFFTYTGPATSSVRERMSILDNGYIGIGTTTPTAVLDVNGTLRFRGGSPAAGKILTSDANGNATWQNPAQASVVAFRTSGLLAGDVLTLNQQTWTKVLFNQYPQYNYGYGYQGLAGNFVATVKGIYHFDARIDLKEQQWEMRFKLVQKRGNSAWDAAYIWNTALSASGNGVSQFHNLIISTDIMAESGDTFWIEAYSYGVSALDISPNARGNWFSAHLVAAL